VCPCVRDHILKVCEHGILQTAAGSFAKFTPSAQLGTKMRANTLNKGTIGILNVPCLNVMVVDNLSGKGILVDGLPARII